MEGTKQGNSRTPPGLLFTLFIQHSASRAPLSDLILPQARKPQREAAGPLDIGCWDKTGRDKCLQRWRAYLSDAACCCCQCYMN